MAIKVVIFLGMIAIALGSITGDHKKTTLDSKQLAPVQGFVARKYTMKPFPRPFIPIRKIRSPEGGSVGVNIDHNDKSGTTGSVNANQNIWSSSDGKTSIDANAGASKNFDHGNSNANVGVSLNHQW